MFAAHLEGKNEYDREDYSGGTAFLIGNEGNGLRDEVAECADCRGAYPHAGAGGIAECRGGRGGAYV